MIIPKGIFFTRGVGRHKEYLQSFELALRAAGVEKLNLVTVSSIFPPGCKKMSKKKGIERMVAGQIAFCVMAKNSSNEFNRLLTAAVGVAIPSEGSHYGYLSEYHSRGETQKVAADYAEDLAATMLATTLGIEFNPDEAYDSRKQVYKMSGKIIRTDAIAQASRVRKKNEWTTVVALGVFIY